MVEEDVGFHDTVCQMRDYVNLIIENDTRLANLDTESTEVLRLRRMQMDLHIKFRQYNKAQDVVYKTLLLISSFKTNSANGGRYEE